MHLTNRGLHREHVASNVLGIPHSEVVRFDAEAPARLAFHSACVAGRVRSVNVLSSREVLDGTILPQMIDSFAHPGQRSY